MAWIEQYVSVGGRYTGRIPTSTYSEQFLYDGWVSIDTYLRAGSGYIARGSFDPISHNPAGWNPSADTYPAEPFILKFTDEDSNETFVRFYLDSSTIWRVQSAASSSGPWTDIVSYNIGNAGIWAGPEEREIDGHTYVGLTSYFQSSHSDVGDSWDRRSIMFNISLFADVYGEPEAEEVSPDYGEASGPGGYDGGTFDDSSDVIGVPTMPSIGVSSIGFVNVYNPSSGALTQLGEELFPDFTPISPYTPTGNTVIDAITDVAEALANIASNIPNVIAMYANAQLINYIIDCHIIPVTPTVGSSQAIKIGYRTMSQFAPKVSSDYVDCDCGNISIGEYYRNFIDYGPYTQAKLFLPFVGFVPIEPELFQSGVLHVIYRFNVIDGSFMAFVLSTSSKSKLANTVIGQWGGNACVHVPITGINYSNMVSGIAAGASATVAEIGKGSLIGAADAALNTSTAAPALQSSNGYNATTSFLSVRTPYLVIERSVSHYSKDYGHEQGYPSEITADWSKLSGYTESDSIHLDGLGATEEELKEISSLLAAGVIL